MTTKNNRMLQFSLLGAVVALLLMAQGYRMDHATPAIPLRDQLVYNWLTLVFGPAGFLQRLTTPDGPIFASWWSAPVFLVSNTVYYATVCKLVLVLRRRPRACHRRTNWRRRRTTLLLGRLTWRRTRS